jgi:hypothetical protein
MRYNSPIQSTHTVASLVVTMWDGNRILASPRSGPTSNKDKVTGFDGFAMGLYIVQEVDPILGNKKKD